jgi:uncharacterized protein YfaA (DUF2138 family)
MAASILAETDSKPSRRRMEKRSATGKVSVPMILLKSINCTTAQIAEAVAAAASDPSRVNLAAHVLTETRTAVYGRRLANAKGILFTCTSIVRRPVDLAVDLHDLSGPGLGLRLNLGPSL